MMLPIASLSLDLDNKWSYLKTHGDRDWDTFPSYLDVVVPRFLQVLDTLGLRITVFVVGQDAALENNAAAFAGLAATEHEIGNHSFHHEPWLHLYSREQVEEEISVAEEHIQAATGQRPIGFRGPGYSMSPTVLEVLVDRGYEYDGSTFPTFLGPLARAYYFLTARLTPEQRVERKRLFGKWSEGFRSNRAHWRQAGTGRLVEIPVTTMPFFRVPIHMSYLLYLRTFSRIAAWSYWRVAMTLCRLTGLGPSLLLHPLDFLGGDDEPDLSFFPAMKLTGDVKTAFVTQVLRDFKRRFQVGPMIEHARSFGGQPDAAVERVKVGGDVPTPAYPEGVPRP